MIIRRQLYPQNKVPVKKLKDTGVELKPIYKKDEQPSLFNKLTDVASTSVTRDADTLLKPINQQNIWDETSPQNQSLACKERTERNLWRNDEVMEMLYTMQQVKALEKLNDKTVKSENVFKDVEVIMHRNGFVKKSHVQIWTKWKFLKSTYMTSRRNGIVPRIVPPQIYETIHQMVTGLNQGLADSCNSTNNSMDGDTSSTNGMVISGVEGGVSDVGVTNGDGDDSFGMAHPIFGFRLGIVKAEPADTGYETLGNNDSNKDPLEKDVSNSNSDKNVKEETSNNEPKTNTVEPIQKVLEVPHRGRGRPPKNPPAATSTPNNKPSPAAKNTQMPPLRVAPFAKDINSANAIAVNRPPPPLTMPPTPRIRVANLSNFVNEDPVEFVQPKLMPKPSHQEPSPISLSKEITIQTRSTSTPSPSYPKMKQIPMRKTPYSLRPDRAIPDLEVSLSPPPTPFIEKPLPKKLNEVSSTKHFMMPTNSTKVQNGTSRKRRSEWQDTTVPDKHSKCINNNTDDEDDISKSENDKNAKHDGKILQNVIIDLSSSLRKMQTQMMRDFFNKQNELLEREHQFQLQQDRMIMKAFQEQTQEIMHSVKQLVGTIKTYKNDQLFEGNESETKKTKTNKNRREQKTKSRTVQAQEREEEIIQEVGDQDDEQQQMEIYSEGEQDQDDNDQEENDLDDDEDVHEQHEDDDRSQLATERNDNDDSDTADHDPIRMVSSELKRS